MFTLEKAIIKKYWPADDKGEDDLVVRQVVIQAEAEIEDGSQLSELYKNMVRGLNRLLILDNLSGEEYELAAVTLKPFNIKQKKITVGKGEENEYLKQEYAALTLVCRAPDDDGARVLAELYRFFNIEVQLTFEVFLQPKEKKGAKSKD